MKKWIVALLVIALAVFMLGCQAAKTETTQSNTGSSEKSKEASNEPYVIGAVVSVTGPTAALGVQEKNTLQMEVDKINKAGGINGHKIDLKVEDDQSDPKNAVIAASKLIDEEHVIALIGGTGSPATLAMKPKTAEAKIPQIAMAAGIKITEAPNEWIVRTAQSDAVAVQKVIDYMSKTLKIKKFAILSDANAFGQSGSTELNKLAPKAGLEVVASETYKTDDTDVSSQLTKINGAKPDVVVVWGTNPGPAVAAKSMKQLGMKMPYIGSHGIANKTFLTLAGSAAEGVVFPAGKILVSSSATGDQADVIKAFMSDYKAKYGENANSFAGHAYDAINILANALKEAGSDNEKLRDAIEKTKDFVGISGIISYGADNHDGTAGSDMIMVEVKDGKWIEKK
ncbi:MAG: ABC transporter substrate-binding protein [Candidatus Aquicultor sp.]